MLRCLKLRSFQEKSSNILNILMKTLKIEILVDILLTVDIFLKGKKINSGDISSAREIKRSRLLQLINTDALRYITVKTDISVDTKL